MLLVLLAAMIGQLFIWVIWDPTFGDALKNLITYSMGLLVGMLLLGWWFIFAPCSWRTVLAVGVPIVVLLLGFVASIRRFDNTGDVGITLEFRWQPTNEQRLAEHRKRVGSAAAGTVATLPELTSEDLPGYRGADRLGIVTGPPLSQDWQRNPPRELWRQPVGGGYAQFAVAGDLLVTIEQRGSEEAVVCYDAGTGLERWVFSYPALFDEAMGGPGPRTTPSLSEDAVYSVGALGDVYCLDLATGKQRWHFNMLKAYGLPNTEWAASSSPLLHGTKVILNAGGPQGNGLVALHRETGAVIWETAGLKAPQTTPPRNRPGYASPLLATLQGVEQVLNFDGTGLRGYDPDTGELWWEFPFDHTSSAGINAAQPVVLEDGRILITASYNMGAVMLKVTRTEAAWQTEELWKNMNLRGKFSSPHMIDGYIYGLDEGIMVCLDAATGERVWKGSRDGLRGRYGHGQQLLTNGQLLVLTEQGQLVLVQPSPERLIEVTSFQALKGRKVWNPLALSRGIAYVRNHEEMAAFDLRAQTTPASPDVARVSVD
jgi:outer membrane protein assembly factor BamB